MSYKKWSTVKSKCKLLLGALAYCLLYFLEKKNNWSRVDQQMKGVKPKIIITLSDH